MSTGTTNKLLTAHNLQIGLFEKRHPKLVLGLTVRAQKLAVLADWQSIINDDLAQNAVDKQLDLQKSYMLVPLN